MNSRRIERDKSLAALYPEIAAQWHPTKNGESSPYDVSSGSSVKAWWLCNKGHEWQAATCHRTRNHSNCPYCSGRYAIKGENDLATLYPDLVKEWNYEKNGDLRPSDCKPASNKKVWWVCGEGHEWQTMVYHRTSRSTGCPYCSGNIVIPGETDLQTLFPEISREFDAGKNEGITPTEICAKSGKKVWWLCQKGHEWKATVSDRSDGKGCPFCSGKRPIPGETDLATLMPEIAAEWNYEKNRGKTPQMFTRASGLKVWWKCPQGHSWRATILARSRNGSGCPRCAKQRYFSGGGF